MAAADGTLKFDTQIDTSGFESGVDTIESKALSVADIIKGSLGADALKEVASAVVEFGKKAISLASDLEEVQNVVDVTFGESADKIQEFADTASEQFGLTEIQVKQFSGTFGAMIKSMGLSEDAAADMALDLTGLTADMASFYNLDHDTAFEKLRSGLSGETEPLKALGINMSVANLEAFALAEGIEKAYDEMTEAERVQLRYNYIMDATSDSQGDFSRTSDGFANQLRLLSNNIDSLAANIGAALLPAANEVLNVVNGLFTIGSEKNETLARIQELSDAISGENGLKSQLGDLQDNYAQTTIEINLDYKNAMDSLNDYYDLLDKFIEDGGEYSGTEYTIGMNGDEVTRIQQQLQDLGYLSEDFADWGTYTSETETAIASFQEANSLAIDGIAGIQTQNALIAATYGELSETVTTLTTLYPELAQYVGENGLLTLEREQVQGLIGDYKDLAQAKAMETLIGDSESVWLEAYANYQFLEQENINAQDSLDGYRDTLADTMAFLEAAQAMDFGAGLGSTVGMFGNYHFELNSDLDIDAIKDRLQLLRQIAEYAPEAFNAAAESADSNFDWSFFFSDDLFDDYIDQLDVEGMSDKAASAISRLMTNMIPSEGEFDFADARMTGKFDGAGFIGGLITDAQTDYENAAAAVNESSAAMAEGAEVLNAALDDLNTRVDTYNRIYGDEYGEIASVAGEKIDYSAQVATQKLSGHLDDMASIVSEKVSNILSTIDSLGNTSSIYSRSNASARGHATGLSYVPYNGYQASLHVGERVLTAAENRAYSAGNGNDLSALVAALSQSQRPSNIVVTVNGKELARYMADDTRSALSERSKRLAKGRGL